MPPGTHADVIWVNPDSNLQITDHINLIDTTKTIKNMSQSRETFVRLQYPFGKRE